AGPRSLHSFPTRRSSGLEAYAPDVLESFQKLVATGHVELLNETYTHALCALKSKEEFYDMVEKHQQKIKTLFNGYTPKIFRNTRSESTRLNSSHVKISYA